MHSDQGYIIALRREVNQMQKSLSDSRLLQQSQQASQTAVEQMRFDTQLARFEADHPVINPDSDDFSEETANEVAEMLQAFKATGLTATAALNKAMHYVLPSDNYQQVQDPDIVRSKRSQAARRKVAKVAKKSPPSLKDTGRDSGKHGADDGLPDITHMDMDDFDKLPEKTKKAMRGDSLA